MFHRIWEAFDKPGLQRSFVDDLILTAVCAMAIGLGLLIAWAVLYYEWGNRVYRFITRAGKLKRKNGLDRKSVKDLDP